ncbi:hypothetical protein JTB14_023121 [Gonioctena quinquepunctata]|nr:hypothetical protein JTB14_023121 [Gonioctena quinquepunctata]
MAKDQKSGQTPRLAWTGPRGEVMRRQMRTNRLGIFADYYREVHRTTDDVTEYQRECTRMPRKLRERPTPVNPSNTFARMMTSPEEIVGVIRGLPTNKAPGPDGTAENLKTLADACQSFRNIHYAISAHRKYKIIPHLNQDCRRVAKTMNVDEFLLTKNFAEAVKNEQAMRKTSSEFNKTTWQPTNSPGPSGTQQSRHLNYQRPKYKGRIKEQKRKERKLTPTRYKAPIKERRYQRWKKIHCKR